MSIVGPRVVMDYMHVHVWCTVYMHMWLSNTYKTSDLSANELYLVDIPTILVSLLDVGTVMIGLTFKKKTKS